MESTKKQVNESIFSREADDHFLSHGQWVICGERIDKNTALYFLEHVDDADLNTQINHDLIILLFFIMVHERKSTEHDVKSLDSLVTMVKVKELSILIAEYALQKKVIEEDSSEFRKMFISKWWTRRVLQ